MRYLILSDIHANWEALEAVLSEASREAIDAILCLGDMVGYGADPDRCVEWFRENARTVVRGNHDRACVGLASLEWFNPVAQESARWTSQTLQAHNSSWLASLPAGPVAFEGFQLVHGSPTDEDEYILTRGEALSLIGYLAEPVTFFGHTHVQGGFRLMRNGAREIQSMDDRAVRAEYGFDPDTMYLINPGAVGQPRDHDPRAAWAIFEPAERRVIYRRTAYDIRRAQEKIVAAGLPESLANRLAVGK